MHDVKQDSETISLKQTLGVLRRRLPVIVLCAVVVAGAAFAFSKQEAKKYTSTASLLFSNSGLTNAIAGLPANSSGVSLLAQQASDLELVKLGDMAAKTASRLGHGLTEQEVSESVAVAGQGESGVVNVSASASSPALAAEIANTYVHRFVEDQKASNQRYFKSALALVHKQLAALSRKQRVGADGLQLQDRAQTLGLLSELNQGEVQVAQEAVASTSPSSPKTSRNTAIGGILGLIIGLALAFILESFDRRVRAPEDLEAIYRLPVLGSVPPSKGLAKKEVAPSPAEAEAFGLIRARLRSMHNDRDLRTVAIISPEAGEGKTTVALRLAQAAARSGSRVLLLEMDLRAPTLAQRLGLPAGPGIVDVLSGVVAMTEATRSVDVAGSASMSERKRSYDVCVAGAAMPPDPSELLESTALLAVLERARSLYDFVVIDTPPLTSVPDAFPLLTRVDGVIVVGFVGRSRRESAEQLEQMLLGSGAPLVGVIANGSKSGGSRAYPRGDRSSRMVVSTNGASSSEPFIPVGKV
jgi:capsular exopolysaccharide synthesis family protein